MGTACERFSLHPVRVPWILAPLIAALLYQPLHAAILTAPGATVQPNNGDLLGHGNPNIRQLGTLWLGLEGRAETAFAIEDSGGTTEYALSVVVTNSSARDWSGYRFALGVDTGTGDVPMLSRGGDGFAFDVPGYADDARPESNGPLVLSWQAEDVLDFRGPFADGATVRFSFSVDVPDRLGVQHIWLLEQPAPVPEAGSFVLLAAGLGAMVLATRRLRSRRRP